jgi:translocation and assembly module TamB
LLGALVGFLVLIPVVIGGVYWYSTTPAFENKVRSILISTLEDSVGGRVELGAVRWRLFHLEFEADNLTIHGLEAAGEVPFAHLDRLRVRVKIISFFRAKIGLNYLGVDRPAVHLIVYKDGSTNQPAPRKKSAPSNKSTTDTIFDLAVDRTEINNGIALLNQQALPFSLAANDLALGVNYVPASDHYTGTLSIADITAQRGIQAPIHSRLTLEATAGRNEASITSLTFTAGASTLAAHAQVSNFNDPHWQMGAKGTVDLREAEALAAVPGLDQGVIALDLHGKGTKSLFTIDGETRLGGVSYVASGVAIRGLNASTKLHVTQDELSLNNLVAHLARGGTVDGEAHLYNWLSPTTPASSAPVTAPLARGGKASAVSEAAKQLNQAAADATANPGAKSQPSRGVVKARLSGFTLPTILSIVAPPKFQDLGFATSASGTVELTWVGNPSDLDAQAKIALNAPPNPGHGDVPVNGAIDVAYSGRGNSVVVRQLDAHTPGTQVQVTGGIGLEAGRGSSLKASVSVSDLGEFNRALIAFGVAANGKKGTQAIPVQLHGQAQFQGTVTGNLAAPDVKGHLDVNNFDIALNQGTPAAAAGAQVVNAAGKPTPAGQAAKNAGMKNCTVPGGGGAVVTCTNPSGEQVPIQVAQTPAPPPGSPVLTSPVAVPPPASNPPAPGTVAASVLPQTIHFDSLSADGEYSPELISVQSALLVRGSTQVHASGQLQAHHLGKRRLAFDELSTINATASINKASLTDLFALAGQTIAITGTLTLNTHVTGTLDNLNGGGHLNIAGGQIYGEPYKSLDADLVYAGRDVGASNLIFLEDGGKLTGEGGYSLASKQFRFKAQGAGFDLAHLKAVKAAPLVIGGQLNFAAQGSGTAASQTIEATAHLVNLSVANPAGGAVSTGGIDLTAHTQAGRLLLDLTARLNGAVAQLHGTTALTGQYQTQARLTLSNLDLNPYLALFNVQGITGRSQIAGTVTLDGPLATPRSLNGDVQLSRLEVLAQGIALGTDGGLHATLRGGTFTLEPVHVTGGGTDLHAGGSADLFGTGRALDATAKGSLDLKVVHTLVPDATASGLVSLNMNVGGTLEKPDLQGKVTLADVNLAYASLPNGLSGMNGNLIFDEGRLQVENLTATSGGGQLTFGGFVAYQQGVYADLNAVGQGVRVRYAGGISVLLDSKIRVQGTLANLLVSGGVTINRFSVGPNLDLSTFNSNGISPPPDPDAFGNRIRLDIRVRSAPQLDINNSYAKLAGDINLNIRGTAADPSVLGHISITEGEATFAGTHYSLQHGDIYFTNPVRIEPTIDLEATAHVEDYDVLLGLHGTPDKLSPSFRSEPPLSEQDIFQLLAVGKTQEEQQIYSQQQSQAGVNSTEDSLLGGALNATVSSRINKLFGGGSVKIDPTFVSGTGNSTARITVQQQVSKSGTVTYATNINSTNQQLIQGQFNLTPQVSVIAVRDESGVFSVILKLHQRYR